MITGDNPLTAASVARECGLINQAAHIFYPVFARGSYSVNLSFSRANVNRVGNTLTPESRLEWPCTDDPSWMLDSYSLKPLVPPAHHTVEAIELDYHDYALVVTGDVFRWMINYAPLETLQRVSRRLGIFTESSKVSN